jgi:predicted aconitase
MYEMEQMSKLMIGKEFSKKCIIFCARPVYEKSCKSGVAKILEKAGANIICDACTCLSPLLSRDEYDGVITNSVKAAHYLNKSNGISVCLKDLKSIIMDHTK